jgi:DNA polymerase
MAEDIRGRIRLWLRSERAMGLHALPLRAEGMVMPAVLPMQQQAPAARMQPASVPRAAAPAPPPMRAAAAGSSMLDMLIAPESAAFTGPALPRDEKLRLLNDLNQTQVANCARCRLCEKRTQTVFGEGAVDAQLMFIGEGPGETEDQTGRPFVGRAGQKLDEMIGAMGLRRDQVYICNIVKCRPPGNRQPAADEIEACTPYLMRQIEVIRPKVIVTLGLPATQYMLQSKISMGRLRGQWHQWRGIKLMPTFHPSYILRVYTMETRKAVWSDLQKVMAELGLTLGKKTSQT